MVELKKVCMANQIHIEDIPQFVIHLMKTKVPYSLQPHSIDGGLRARYDKTTQLSIEEFVPPFIFRQLYQFQKDTIKKAVKMHGRILINDDFGSGKSVQALSISLAYKQEWPLVVLCP